MREDGVEKVGQGHETVWLFLFLLSVLNHVQIIWHGPCVQAGMGGHALSMGLTQNSMSFLLILTTSDSYEPMTHFHRAHHMPWCHACQGVSELQEHCPHGRPVDQSPIKNMNVICLEVVTPDL